jgi:hypothetical protein
MNTMASPLPENEGQRSRFGANRQAEGACSLRGLRSTTDWSRDVPVHFSYHSQTQRTVHTTPFLWLVCAGMWLGITTQEVGGLSGTLVLLAFVWLFLTNSLMNALVRYRGMRFGPVDLSKNLSPSPTEKLLNRVFLVVALAAGIITAAVSVQDTTHVELKILLAFIVFLAVAALTDGTLTLAVIVLSGFRIRPVRG